MVNFSINNCQKGHKNENKNYLKLFKSIDDAILFLKKSDNKKSIKELENLRERVAGDKKVKAVRVTEENDIIEYESVEEMKKSNNLN